MNRQIISKKYPKPKYKLIYGWCELTDRLIDCVVTAIEKTTNVSTPTEDVFTPVVLATDIKNQEYAKN